MAVTHNSAASNSVVGASSLSLVTGVAAGSDLAAAISIAYQENIGAVVQAVTFGGVTATFIQLVQNLGIVEQYYVKGVTPGSRTLSVTWNGVVAAAVIGVEVMNNVNQTTPLGTSKTALGTNNAPSVTLTGTIAGSFIVDGVIVDVGTPTTVVPNATQEQRWASTIGSSPDRITGGCSTELSGGGSVLMNWALGGNRLWSTAAAEFLAVADTGKPVNVGTSYNYGADPLPLESFKDPAVQQRIWVNDRRHMQGDL